MNHYIFQVSEMNEMTAYEWFKHLVVDKNEQDDNNLKK